MGRERGKEERKSREYLSQAQVCKTHNLLHEPKVQSWSVQGVPPYPWVKLLLGVGGYMPGEKHGEGLETSFSAGPSLSSSKDSGWHPQAALVSIWSPRVSPGRAQLCPCPPAYKPSSDPSPFPGLTCSFSPCLCLSVCLCLSLSLLSVSLSLCLSLMQTHTHTPGPLPSLAASSYLSPSPAP